MVKLIKILQIVRLISAIACIFSLLMHKLLIVETITIQSILSFWMSFFAFSLGFEMYIRDRKNFIGIFITLFALIMLIMTLLGYFI